MKIKRITNSHCDASDSTIELDAEPLSLLDAATRVSVDFGHITRDSFLKTLSRRQTTAEEIEEDQSDDTLNFHENGTISLDTSFPPRVILYPLDLPNVVDVAGSVARYIHTHTYISQHQ